MSKEVDAVVTPINSIKKEETPLDLSFPSWNGCSLRLVPPKEQEDGSYLTMWDKQLLLEKTTEQSRLEYQSYNEGRIELLKKEFLFYLDSLERRQDPLNVKNYYLTSVVSWDDKLKEIKVHEYHHLPIQYVEANVDVIVGADYVYNGYTEDEMMIRDAIHGKRKRH